MYSLKLRKVSEDWHGFPWGWLIPVGIYGLITVFIPFMVFVIASSIIIKAVMIMIGIAAGIGLYVKMRSPAILESTMLEIQYRYRVHKGEHIIPKHIVPLQFLKGLVPLETAHPNGLIEYTENRYGIIYQLFVHNRTGSDLEAFIALVTKNIVDRIHDGQVLKVFEMQRYTTDISIKNQVVAAMNDDTKTPEQRAHLESIYKQLVANTEVPTKRYIYASIILGRFDNIEDAEAERTNLTPSIEDGFRLGGIGYNMLIESDSIGRALRRCMK